MVAEFKLPDVGEGVAEGELVTWLVEPGDTVTEDQPVAEVETDKALVEVPSPYNGTVNELLAEEGEMVPVGDVIITFNVDGEDDSSETADAEAGSSQQDDTASTTASSAAGESDSAEEVDTPEGRVFAPPRVRKLARQEGVDISSVQGSGPGGRITEGDVQAAADDEGDPEPDTAPAATETTQDAGGVDASGDQVTTADSTSSASVESADRDRTLAAPATRRVADEQGVDINAVPATDEREGEPFVTAEAVMEYAEAQQRAQEADAAAVATGDTGPRETREPFKGVRKTIAEAMERSKYTAPHVTHHDEVDVTRLVEMRERLKPKPKHRASGSRTCRSS